MYQTLCSPLDCFGQEYLIEICFVYNGMQRFKVQFHKFWQMHAPAYPMPLSIYKTFLSPRKVFLPCKSPSHFKYNCSSDFFCHRVSHLACFNISWKWNHTILCLILSLSILFFEIILPHLLAVSFYCYILFPCVNKTLCF